MALTYTPQTEYGTLCPQFTLPAVNGESYSLKDFQNGKPYLVMFICNHCPYVEAIEDRLIALSHELKSQDVNVIAICSNDSKNNPEDSFENMKKRSEAKGYPFPYLHDEDQKVAHAFGAVCTPDFFVYDGLNQLAYRGRLDDSWKDPSKVTKRDLYQAIQFLLKNQQPPSDQIPSMGCNIKWTSR